MANCEVHSLRHQVDISISQVQIDAYLGVFREKTVHDRHDATPAQILGRAQANRAGHLFHTQLDPAFQLVRLGEQPACAFGEDAALVEAIVRKWRSVIEQRPASNVRHRAADPQEGRPKIQL